MELPPFWSSRLRCSNGNNHFNQKLSTSIPMANAQGSHRLESFWGVVKAIAYELRPFTLPSTGDLKRTAKKMEINAKQLWAEGGRLMPEIVEGAKGVNPLKALKIVAWLIGWAMFTWIEFGAVYFIVSAIAMVFINLGESDEGEWSAYSVFNAGCRALLGTMNAEQFEREIMHQNPGAPVEPRQEDEFVWVEPPPAARVDDDVDNGRDDDGEDDDEDDGKDPGDDDYWGGNGAEGAGDGIDGDADTDRQRARRVSGKRARRGFEGRKERREERRQALAALGPDEWE